MKRRNPTAHRWLTDALAEMILPLEPAWRKTLLDNLTNHAEKQIPRFIAYWSTVQPKEKIPRYYDRIGRDERQAPPPSTYVTHPHDNYAFSRLHTQYGSQVHAAQTGTAKVNLKKVSEDAELMFQEIRGAFIARAAEKLGHLAGARVIRNLEGRLRLRGFIEGTITAHIDAQNYVTLDAATKTNYRYGENAANRDITQYTQYPFRIVEAVVEGLSVAAPSDDKVAALWGGASSHEKAAEAKKTKAGWKTTKEELENEVDNWKEVSSAVNEYAKALALAVIAADPSHPKHAKMQRDSDKSFDAFAQRHPWLLESGSLKKSALVEAYPMPRQPGATKYLARLGLTEWPSPEEAKAALADAKARFDAHKLTKNNPPRGVVVTLRRGNKTKRVRI